MSDYMRHYRQTHKAQFKVYSKRYSDKHKEERKAYIAVYAKKNKEKISEQKRAYHLLHKDRINENHRLRRRQIKREVFEAYGGAICICCGEKEIAFLSIDHVNGGGSMHQKEIGKGALYGWLIKNSFPSGYQVLCMNCQFGRKHNNGICPHRKSL